MNSAPAAAAGESGSAPRFSLRQRLLLWLATWAGFLLIRLLGRTLRYSLSIDQEGGPPVEFMRPAIYPFWHRCLIPACYKYGRREIAVMTSRSFDGEFIARILEKLGYVPVRGSSSRGAAGALLGLHSEIERGRSVAFTIDGPRGPRYVAKPGPVLLARNTGAPIIPFYCAPQRTWVLRSWDAFMIPKPFSQVLVRVGKVIRVPPHANDADMQRYHSEMQDGLDRVREFAEASASRLAR